MDRRVVIDLEMCKVPRSHRRGYGLSMEIIQIGAVILDENGEIQSKFISYVRPEFGYVDSQINRLTGIQQQDVKKAPVLQGVLTSFSKWIGNDPIIMISWSLTDQSQLYNEVKAKGIDGAAIQATIKSWEDCQAIFAEKMDVHRAYSLDYAIKVTDIQMEGKEHDALADAYNTALLYRKMKQEEKLILNRFYIEAMREEPLEPLQYSLGEILKGIRVIV